jgi:hypothetical protein
MTASGISDIDIFDSKLLDDSGNPIPHNLVDGGFGSTKPFVDFTWTPSGPDVGEVVTFDGTASFDPDGGSIVSYEWDFGDGDTDTGSIVTHTYDDYADPWYVTLNCTDDEGEWYAVTKELRIWRVIVCGPIWYDPSMFLDLSVFQNALGADCWMHVAVANLGSIDETFDLNVWAVHEETGYEPTLMPLWGNPVTVPAGGGMGFGSLFLWLASEDDLPGYYIIHAEAVVDDMYTGDNHATLRIELGEADLVGFGAKPEGGRSGFFKIHAKGNELSLYGKMKNIQPAEADSMGFYCWVRFEVIHPDSSVTIIDTNEQYLMNGEESDVLMASLPVEEGTYQFTAWGVFSYMDYASTAFYEEDIASWLGPFMLKGTSETTKTFSVAVLP